MFFIFPLLSRLLGAAGIGSIVALIVNLFK